MTDFALEKHNFKGPPESLSAGVNLRDFTIKYMQNPIVFANNLFAGQVIFYIAFVYNITNKGLKGATYGLLN